MKLLIVGSDKVFSIENFYVKYLKLSGVDVSVFLSPNIFNDYYTKNILNKIKFRVGISGIYNFINRDFRNVVEEVHPDIIWIFKGMEIFPESIHWAKSRGIKLVNYNTDNPFLFSGKGSGNRNITDSIKGYDLHFTYNLRVKKRIEDEYGLKTCFLPFGFEIGDSLYDHCSKVEEIKGVCFLGNPDRNRADFIKELADAGVNISVFGVQWSKYVNHPLIQCGDVVLGVRQFEILRKYRIQLNLMRPHNMDSHNMRTFEVPGVGGIMLAPRNSEHSLFFQEKKEAFFYDDSTECIKWINHLFSLSNDEILQIRRAARDRSVYSGYSYERRAHEVLSELNKI